MPCYNLVTFKGTQIHLTTTNTIHKERTYTMSIDNLLDLIIQYKQAAQLIETAQAEQETIKAQIKAEMTQRNTNDLQVGCHKVKARCKGLHANPPERAVNIVYTRPAYLASRKVVHP